MRKGSFVSRVWACLGAAPEGWQLCHGGFGEIDQPVGVCILASPILNLGSDDCTCPVIGQPDVTPGQKVGFEEV
jgi:hypothetical protein